MDSPMVVLKDLYKKIGNTAVIRDVDLTLSENSITLLLGDSDSDSGKSVFLKLLAGLLPPDRGSITIDGLSPRDAVLAGKVAYLSSRPSLPELLTVPEAVAFLADVVPTFDKNRAEALLSDLRVKQNKPIKSFSKSTKAKIYLIFTMCHSARVYLLDMPLMGDETVKAYLLRIIRENRAEGSAVILATRNRAGTEDFTENAILLADGKLIPNEEGRDAVC